jgi:BirA family biotin operon repressor/biotin-[acetyl-CoA-carboxylase] ligase
MSHLSYDGKPGPAADILVLLKREKEKFLTSRDIAVALSVSRQSVYDAISYLRDCGYEIEANRKAGYKLKKIPDNLSPVEIAAGLKRKKMACQIYSYRSVASTNAVAHDLAKSGYPEGTLVIADTQTKGRGRMGRKWHSPSGKGLYFSLILRPDITPDKAAGFSLVAGLAIVRAIKETTGIYTQTKWPNDVLYKAKKIAGILVELTAELDKINYMVLGCGVNVNHMRKDFPFNLQRKAGSLKMVNKKDTPRVLLLQSIIQQFEILYDNFIKHGFRYLTKELIQNSAVIGKRVTITSGKDKVTGKAVGIDNVGRLIIKSRHKLMSYVAGEVTLR